MVINHSRVGFEDIEAVRHVRTARRVQGPHPLNWLLQIDDPSGRLILSILCLASLDFDVKYEKVKINTKADVLSLIHPTAKAIPHNGKTDITLFELDYVNV